MGYNNNQMIVKKFVTGAVKDRMQKSEKKDGKRYEENEKSIGFGDGGTDVYGADCMWQRF